MRLVFNVFFDIENYEDFFKPVAPIFHFYETVV